VDSRRIQRAIYFKPIREPRRVRRTEEIVQDWYGLAHGGKDRRFAFRLGEIGEDEADLIRWRAKEPRELTAEECRAGLWLLEAKPVRQWLTKWSYGDSSCDPHGRGASKSRRSRRVGFVFS